MTRKGWGVVILLAWGLSLGWLVKREFFRPTAARLAEAARGISPGAAYYRLDVAGTQVGFASTTVDTMSDSIRVDESLVLEIAALGHLSRTSARSTAIVGRTLRLRNIDVRFDGDFGAYTVRGDVAGDTVLRLTLVSGGDTQTARVPLPRPVVLPTLLPLRLAYGGELRPGAVRTARVFDPLLLTQRDVRVTIGDESTLVLADSAAFDSTAMAWVAARFDTVRAVRIETTGAGPATSIWVDAQGRVARASSVRGFTTERTAFEIAYENFRRRDTTRVRRASERPTAGDVVPTTAIAAGAPLRADGPGELRVRLADAGLAGLNLAGGRQALVGDTLIVRRETAAQLTARYRLPAPPDSLYGPWLGPEPLVEADNPRLRAQARLLANHARDPAQVAERIVRWVHDAVDNQPARSLPDAVHVFESRRGDCNEHTVLYVALARAAGIPARTAAGLLYLGGRFYYHAWPEVYLGDWVAVDPTLGQFPADAGHVRFVVGGLARQVELLPILGRLRLEVL